ncbi:ribonuclease P [Saccharomyces eubayanus]|uniref:ribonuclease P n=1 Tax=Saccharomyces eubayanus TaxID=1080349 RepID=UPI0006BF62E3|nr:RPM2-like protein [Saccharomyces eubayanus]KOG97264.1 RPM2-like protein [Saccharomyces eubayanus]
MAFKSFKYNIYSKGYHRSAAQKKNATSFFDSSYQYLRQNQGLVNSDPVLHASHLHPHPVVVANVNYNNVDDVLHLHDLDSPLNISTNPLTHDELLYNQNVSLRSLKQQQNNNNANNSSTQHRYYSTGPTVPANQYDSLNFSSRNFQDLQSKQQPPPVQKQQQQEYNLLEDENTFVWKEDTEPCLNTSTYLQTHIDEINRCYEQNNYNKINSLYQSLKRNGIVPPLEIFTKVLDSLCKRPLDNNDLDNKMYELLTCYQDMINNRMKPPDEIYNIVLLSLFKGSILAYQFKNPNGSDFYKIAIELFNTTTNDPKQKSEVKFRNFSKDVLDYNLLAMNIYPGHITLSKAQQIIKSSPAFIKDSFYFIACFSYAKSTNDKLAIKELYEDFRLSISSSASNQTLFDNQFEIYSVILSSFIETGEVELATNLLDDLVSKIQNSNGLASNISLLLSNFLISMSKIDSSKAYEIWFKFHKLDWIPEFSYEFYLIFMANSFQDWNLTKKIYDYIFPMKRSLSPLKKQKLSDYLLYPMGAESIITSLLDYSLQLKDNEIIMKILEESVIKNFSFDIGIYPFIFNYLREIKCGDEYLMRFIDSHAEFFEKSDSVSKFQFLNSIVDNFQSQSLLNSISHAKFFMNLVKDFNLENCEIVNYNGMITCIHNFVKAPKTIKDFPYILEIHAVLITKLFDFDTYPILQNNSDETLLNFRDQIEHQFRILTQNFYRLNLDPNLLAGVVSQALKMINLDEVTNGQDLLRFFNHPGDWDKSYPLSLGSFIRNSCKAGIREFTKLSKEGYCFDYDTYKALIVNRAINRQIIDRCIEICPDTTELKTLVNLIISKIPGRELTQLVINSSKFNDVFVPNLRNDSMIKLIKNCESLSNFIRVCDFPEKFKSIAIQAENKNAIELIYEKLFDSGNYADILRYNNVVPVLNLELLLKSCIRYGEFKKFESLFKKFNDKINESSKIDIQLEYLINKNDLKGALELFAKTPKDLRTPHKTMDLYTFALFLDSFNRDITYYETPENTLQFANILSSQASYINLLSTYNLIAHSDQLMSFNTGGMASKVKKEILTQMLNNLYDSVRLLSSSIETDESMKQTLREKVQNYCRFKAYLKSPELDIDELKTLISVESFLNPFTPSILFNNLVETAYLNEHAPSLVLQNGLIYSFQKDSLIKVLDYLEEQFASNGDNSSIEKVREFKFVLSKSKSLQL